MSVRRGHGYMRTTYVHCRKHYHKREHMYYARHCLMRSHVQMRAHAHVQTHAHVQIQRVRRSRQCVRRSLRGAKRKQYEKVRPEKVRPMCAAACQKEQVPLRQTRDAEADAAAAASTSGGATATMTQKRTIHRAPPTLSPRPRPHHEESRGKRRER